MSTAGRILTADNLNVSFVSGGNCLKLVLKGNFLKKELIPAIRHHKILN